MIAVLPHPKSPVVRTVVSCLFFWSCFGAGLIAADSPPDQAFNVAARSFQDGLYQQAEKQFGDFIKAFPDSDKVSQATLLEARAALSRHDLEKTINLLEAGLPKAGPLVDQYRYWMGAAQMENGHYQAAADLFSLLLKEFASSPRRLEASYGEALAYFKLGDWGRVVELLQRSDGAFRQAAQLRSNDELVVRGYLLLAEAQLSEGHFEQAEAGLHSLAQRELTPEFQWRRQYLLCRIDLGARQYETALQDTTNLLVLAAATGQPDWQGESSALQGNILERMGRLEPALKAYERNLSGDLPNEQRRQALLNIIQLNLLQNRLDEATNRLAQFLAKYPNDTASDLALLTLGEMSLKKFYQSVAGGPQGEPSVTNLLHDARQRFNKLIQDHPRSLLLGKSYLYQGWTFWAGGQISESQAAFKLAMEKLPFSEDLAVARFKWADTQFLQGNYTNAIQMYRSVLRDFAGMPRVENDLFPLALYQTLRAALKINDLASATDSMEKILKAYPHSLFSDRSLLLVGQELTSGGRVSEARKVFESFVGKYPDSPLASEAQLAIARTYVRESDWTRAVESYGNWISKHPKDPLLPQALFNRGWTYYLAGQETNALSSFTNFVASYPGSPLAPRAQYWVGDHYFRKGDYATAELNYQNRILLHNTNASSAQLSYRALMMAGRSAFARQGYKDASDYFSNLISDDNCPTDLRAEAFFALGDTLIMKEDTDANKPLQNFERAKSAFEKIPVLYPSHRLVPYAWGRIGDCYFELGVQNAKYFDNAADCYLKALAGPDLALRMQAEIKLGAVREKQNKLQDAMSHYTHVLYGGLLKDNEPLDPFWVKEAGLAATRLAEQQKAWDVAVNLYKRLSSILPATASFWEKRLEKARQQLSAKR